MTQIPKTLIVVGGGVIGVEYACMLATLGEYSDARLQEIPEAMKARNLRIIDILHIIGWHEGHHQGQAHITFNLYKAST